MLPGHTSVGAFLPLHEVEVVLSISSAHGVQTKKTVMALPGLHQKRRYLVGCSGTFAPMRNTTPMREHLRGNRVVSLLV